MAKSSARHSLPDHAFRSIGLPDAEILLLKAELNRALKSAISESGWSQNRTAQELGWAQPDISKLMNDRFVSISLDRLVQAALNLGMSVHFGVGKPVAKTHAARVVLERWRTTTAVSASQRSKKTTSKQMVKQKSGVRRGSVSVHNAAAE